MFTCPYIETIRWRGKPSWVRLSPKEVSMVSLWRWEERRRVDFSSHGRGMAMPMQSPVRQAATNHQGEMPVRFLGGKGIVRGISFSFMRSIRESKGGGGKINSFRGCRDKIYIFFSFCLLALVISFIFAHTHFT